MHRRSLLIAALAVPTLAAGSGDRADIAQVQAYLNGIHTLKARFTQIAPDGTASTGVAWLWRPGRMRFEYDKPSPLLLVAGHGQVIFRDNELDQTSTVPLASSPLGILLAEHVDLYDGSVVVRGIERLPGEISLTLARSATPGEGELTLTLARDPWQLRSWTVTDAQHNQTRVSLSAIDLGAGSFDPALFEYRDPNLPGR